MYRSVINSNLQPIAASFDVKAYNKEKGAAMPVVLMCMIHAAVRCLPLSLFLRHQVALADSREAVEELRSLMLIHC
jgi:hypothetical protein